MGEHTVDLSKLKGISSQDQEMLKQTDDMLGPPPEVMGVIKNTFWGRQHQTPIYPYPQSATDERKACEDLLEKLEPYMKNEHPAILIDRDQRIPQWCIDKLFEIGVMGMTIPKSHGGLGLGVTSYNRILECIGSYCAATSVVVSAHQSIGCKAIMLFGNDEQKEAYLPRLAKDTVSAFCLSEPNVGCDAGGQETHCTLSEDGEHYILNGEKKWSTSGAFSGLFTVMAKQAFTDSSTGEVSHKVTALICTPDMPGIVVTENNRSKCGIRGTWQARIRFENVKVPKANLLHKEGKGLQVALSCLNYGRCTLSAGVVGAAKVSRDRAIKWSSTRYQFQRPLADFALVQKKIAQMEALCFAMDAMLYATTGLLDHHEKDIMVETATCKLFCSEMGWQVINDALQIMGGEGYMTENEVERAMRDSRIYLIVEGANEVMQSFVFGYGGKQLAESLLGLQEAFSWDSDRGGFANLKKIVGNAFKPKLVARAVKVASEVFLGLRQKPDFVRGLHSDCASFNHKLCLDISELSYQFKKTSYRLKEQMVSRQVEQARIADAAMWIHAANCSLSKLDHLKKFVDKMDLKHKRDIEAGEYFMDLAHRKVRECFDKLKSDESERLSSCSLAALQYNPSLDNSDFSIPERSPNAAGTGRCVNKEDIPQFVGPMDHSTTEAPLKTEVL